MPETLQNFQVKPSASLNRPRRAHAWHERLVSGLGHLRLAGLRFFWAGLLGRRCSFGKDVRIYECVKLAVESGGNLQLGRSVALQQGVVIAVKSGARVEIQDEGYIGEYTVIASHASITIGSGVLIGPHCSVVDYNHSFRDKLRRMDPAQVESHPVVIGENAWIGAGCRILAGVHIGEGSVIGAGAVVTHDIPAFAIAVGSPAKILKYRE